ncbi:nitrogen regulation protein NR(II) [Melioribacteraceae bacterium 4301-Me]|uniref:two-component system sensor histidine kinase NtrB n=1 Tax=Pyranulibacter aquaticus TaxID=3163344 RepID=UPI00359964DF
MKKLLLDFFKKYFDSITENWTARVVKLLKGKLTDSQVTTFVESSLRTFMEIIDKSDYSAADNYLIEAYNLFTSSNLNLLEISQIFTSGRYSFIPFIESEHSNDFDPLLVNGYVDELFEQTFARYGMLHQEAQLKDLKNDRDRLAAKLSNNQEYLKSILHLSDSAIMVIDNNEKFIAWNKGAEKIFGYTEQEVIGKPSSLLLPPGEKYLNELKLIQDVVNEKGEIKIFETERKTKYGDIITVKLNVTKLPSNNGEYVGRNVIIKDFTEFKKLQAQVNQSEKLAVIGQLAAGVAHEIGNPLASISSLVQILQRRSKDEFISEQLANIKENIDRISKIVRELVDFSRPPTYEIGLFDLTDIIKTALGIVKYDKRVKKVKFESELEKNLPKVAVPADQLLQVFVNILLNALDAIEGEGNIFVKSYSKDNHVFIEITDDGCGMDKNIIEKIFDPFFTTKETGKGTGLGLSVSYGIIKKINGEIKVKSEPGKGSTFTVIIPIADKLKE